ncbi:hypothetical protein [Desulforegula conservatrix]|uniref:hypothetical protein n=1 Tax=Desulforegula conservatrix TaxID=153026 RepID=UPI0004286CCA|nr:hypothetical protein [Desulforegula conservatrix]
MTERINFLTTKEMKDRIEIAAKQTGQTSSDIVRHALDLYFQKNENTEILNAILQRLDAIKNTTENTERHASRTNIFLNLSAEHFMNSEEYEELRKIVKEDLEKKYNLK